MHISFEGPIAAGKTTLALLLGKHLGADYDVLLENFQDNAFLTDFYADEPRWSLPMQIDFLLSRQDQFSNALFTNKKGSVADHSMAKNHVFASVLLAGRELALYDRIAAALPAATLNPEFVVYLDAPTEVLLERIRVRGRPYESAITADYLEDIRDGYDHYFSKVRSDIRVLKIDASKIDVHSAAGQHSICDEILVRIKRSIPQRAGDPGGIE